MTAPSLDELISAAAWVYDAPEARLGDTVLLQVPAAHWHRFEAIVIDWLWWTLPERDRRRCRLRREA